MSTLAFQFEEITARELKPALLQLDASRASVEQAQDKLRAMLNKRNEYPRELRGRTSSPR